MGLRSVTLIAVTFLVILVIPGYQSGHAQATGWHDVAPLPVALTGMAAATGLDGTVYVFGGVAGNGFSSQTYAYDPGTNSWSTRAPLPIPVNLAGAATGSDGHIYVVGGYNNGPVNYVQEYDPTSNTWACSQAASGCASSSLAPMPTARSELAVTSGPDGTIWAIGGSNGNPLSTVEVYSIASNSWSSGPSLPYQAAGVAAVTGPDSTIYVFGGRDFSGSIHLVLYALPAPSGARFRARFQAQPDWQAIMQYHQNQIRVSDTVDKIILLWLLSFHPYIPSQPNRHLHERAQSAADLQIVLGGVPPTMSGPPSNSVTIWDSATNSFSTGPSLLQGRFESAAAVGNDGTLYAIGGDDGNPINLAAFSSVEAYSPPPPPTLTPTSTPLATATSTPAATATVAPTSTPTSAPTPINTAIPLFVRVSVAHKTIKIGQRQTVSVHTLTGAKVSIAVSYPNRSKSHHSATANARGLVSWRYKQPAGRTRGSNHTVKIGVEASLGPGQVAAANASYSIR